MPLLTTAAFDGDHGVVERDPSIEDYNLGRKDDIYLLDPDDYDLDE